LGGAAGKRIRLFSGSAEFQDRFGDAVCIQVIVRNKFPVRTSGSNVCPGEPYHFNRYKAVMVHANISNGTAKTTRYIMFFYCNKIGTEEYIAEVIIKKSGNDKSYYLHTVEIKSKLHSALRTGSDTSAPSGAFKLIIAQKLSEVKGTRRLIKNLTQKKSCLKIKF
jgi:hypothetical protein